LTFASWSYLMPTTVGVGVAAGHER
jgi:hypothetical protein